MKLQDPNINPIFKIERNNENGRHCIYTVIKSYDASKRMQLYSSNNVTPQSSWSIRANLYIRIYFFYCNNLLGSLGLTIQGICVCSRRQTNQDWGLWVLAREAFMTSRIEGVSFKKQIEEYWTKIKYKSNIMKWNHFTFLFMIMLCDSYSYLFSIYIVFV